MSCCNRLILRDNGLLQMLQVGPITLYRIHTVIDIFQIRRNDFFTFLFVDLLSLGGMSIETSSI